MVERKKEMNPNSTISFLAILVITSVAGCENNSTDLGGSPDWLIPRDQIFDGGPGQDGIPALLNPAFTDPAGATYLTDEDLVIGLRIGSDVRAYPHPILDQHEIINDEIGGAKLAITYCPLTGSGIAWNRVLDGAETTFGVSGLLYNTNLIPYDRATGSRWSQMLMQSVNGPLMGRTIKVTPVFETTWRTWKEMYPQTKVVSQNTGFNRAYRVYPYGSYRTSPSLIFPINNDDRRLPRKERVHGVIVGDRTKAYRIGGFAQGVDILNDEFNGASLVVIGSSGKNVAIAFSRTLEDGTVLTFSPIVDALPIAMVDNEGTQWDIFGRAVNGPRAGSELKAMRGYTAYWFAWGTFFPGAAIH